MASGTACPRGTEAHSQSRTGRCRPRRRPRAFPKAMRTSPPRIPSAEATSSSPRIHSRGLMKKWFRGGCKPNFVFPVLRRRRRSFVSAADTRNRAACAAPERAVPRFPIWPCSRGGFPCPDACAAGGGLLPRLFTLTADRETHGGLFSVALSVDPPLWTDLPRVSPAVPGLRGPVPWRVRTFLPQRCCERPSAPPEPPTP